MSEWSPLATTERLLQQGVRKHVLRVHLSQVNTQISPPL